MEMHPRITRAFFTMLCLIVSSLLFGFHFDDWKIGTAVYLFGLAMRDPWVTIQGDEQ
jgi:hypothetical protein